MSKPSYKMSNFGLNRDNPNWIYNRGEYNLNTAFRGQVVDNKDPMKQGRIKVYIPELMDDEKSSIWCNPIVSNSLYHHIPPQIGDVVIVFFENGNPQLPFYIGNIKLRLSFNNSSETMSKAYFNYTGFNSEVTSENDHWIYQSYDGKFRLRYNKDYNYAEIGNYTNPQINPAIKFDFSSGNIYVRANNYTINTNNSIEIKLNNSTLSMMITMASNSVVIQYGNSRIVMSDSQIVITAPSVIINGQTF